ncbi:MAG: hypothetical protein DMG03_01330, partial [Acidobacteria bacterium]
MRRGRIATITMAVVALTMGTATAAVPVVWTNLVDAIPIGPNNNGLQKNAGCDGCAAGGNSQQSFASGDGYVEFTANENTTNGRFVGLSDVATHDYTLIKWSIKLGAGTIAEVRESNNYRTETTYTANTVFRVAVVGGVVQYSKDGSVFYQSVVSPKYPLMADASLLGASASFANAMFQGGGASSTQITVVQWNIHKGREECPTTPPSGHWDCVNSLDEITTYLVNMNNHADIVSLNEVENQRSPYKNPDGSCCEDQPARIEHDITVGLEAKTQQCWESLFIAPDGSAATGTTGELLLWRSSEKPCGQPGQGTAGFQKQAPPERHQLPFESPDGYRSVGAVTLLIGPTSRPVTFFTTHLCPPPDGCTANQRQAQVDDLKLWAAGKAAPHVIAGDFNALPGASEI